MVAAAATGPGGGPGSLPGPPPGTAPAPSEGGQARFLSLLYGELGPLPGEGGGVRCTLASAGHPLPLLLRPDGTVRAAAEPQLLLGVVEQVAYESRRSTWSPATPCCVSPTASRSAAPVSGCSMTATASRGPWRGAWG